MTRNAFAFENFVTATAFRNWSHVPHCGWLGSSAPLASSLSQLHSLENFLPRCWLSKWTKICMGERFTRLFFALWKIFSILNRCSLGSSWLETNPCRWYMMNITLVQSTRKEDLVHSAVKGNLWSFQVQIRNRKERKWEMSWTVWALSAWTKFFNKLTVALKYPAGSAEFSGLRGINSPESNSKTDGGVPRQNGSPCHVA